MVNKIKTLWEISTSIFPKKIPKGDFPNDNFPSGNFPKVRLDFMIEALRQEHARVREVQQEQTLELAAWENTLWKLPLGKSLGKVPNIVKTTGNELPSHVILSDLNRNPYGVIS